MSDPMITTKVIENEYGKMVACLASTKGNSSIRLALETSDSPDSGVVSEWIVTLKEAEAIRYCLDKLLRNIK